MTTDKAPMHPFFAKACRILKPPLPVTRRPTVRTRVTQRTTNKETVKEHRTSSIPAESSTSAAKRYAKYRETLLQQQRAARREQREEEEREKNELSPLEQAILDFYGPAAETVPVKQPEPKRQTESRWPDASMVHVGMDQEERSKRRSGASSAWTLSSAGTKRQAPWTGPMPKKRKVRQQPRKGHSHTTTVFMNKADVEAWMNRAYSRSNWQSTSACRTMLHRIFDNSSSSNSGSSDGSWTERYRPRQVSDLLSYEEASYTYLRDWLSEFKASPISAPQPTKKPKNKKRRLQSYSPNEQLDPFVLEDDDDPEDGEFTLGHNKKRKRKEKVKSNVILLYGAHGIGKTAAVYAAAEEVGYDVLEINAGSRRSGKDIVAAVGEITSSQQVQSSEKQHRQKEQDQSENKNKRTIMSHFLKPGDKKKPKAEDHENQKQRSMMNRFLNLGDKSQRKEEGQATKKQQIVEPQENKQPNTEARPSLILLEEVDLLYEEDKGFWAAAQELAQRSKRPIVMTCNETDFVPTEMISFQATVPIRAALTKDILPYLQLLCLAEGYLVDPTDLLLIHAVLGDDLRQMIRTLEVFCKQEDANTSELGSNDSSKRFFYKRSHMFTGYMGIGDLGGQGATLLDRRTQVIERCYGMRKNGIDITRLAWDHVAEPDPSDLKKGSIMASFASQDLNAITRAMDTAAFTDAYIAVSPKEEEVYEDENVCGYEKTWALRQETSLSHKLEARVTALNVHRLGCQSWRQRMFEYASDWDELCDLKTESLLESSEAVKRFLTWRMANQPDANVLMTEYVPRIREMCTTETQRDTTSRTRQPRQRHHLRLPDEQLAMLTDKRIKEDETHLWVKYAQSYSKLWKERS